MHVLLVNHAPIPVFAYGGTERVIWDLGRALVQMGHRVSYLVPEGSHCDFAQVLPIRPGLSWAEQVPADVDVVHFQFNPKEDIGRPFLVTEHGNGRDPDPLALNTVFVSRNHAERHGSQRFVHNGLDWMVIAGRPPIDRQYKRLLFSDVFPELGCVPLKHAGNLPHRVMSLKVADVEPLWRASQHPLYDFFFHTRHPDIEIEQAEGSVTQAMQPLSARRSGVEVHLAAQ